MKRLMLPVLAATSLLLGGASFAKSVKVDVKPINKADMSYSIGVMTGRAFKARTISIDTQSYIDGFKAGFTDSKTRMTNDQMKQVLTTYRQQEMAKRTKEMQEKATENSKSGGSFLTANKAKPGVETTPSGLQYKVIDAGSGNSPKATDQVTVDYEGKLVDGTVFDSSYKRGKPATFPVNGVIKGWQEALQMMKPGATWEVVIPGDLAYGKMGMPGTPIGPNATLIFKIHLVSVGK